MLASACFRHWDFLYSDQAKVKYMQLEISADDEEQLVFLAVAQTTNSLWFCFFFEINFKVKFPRENVPNMNLLLVVWNNTVMFWDQKYVMNAECAVISVLSDLKDTEVNGRVLVKLILVFNIGGSNRCLPLQNHASLLLNFLRDTLVYHF